MVRSGECVCRGRQEDLRPVGVSRPRPVTTAAAHLRALHHYYHTSGCLRSASGSDVEQMVEQSYINPANIGTFWFGGVPCGGDLSFLGLDYDGLTSGYQANVLSAVVSSGQGHLTAGVEGVENPACR
jgi:hypothetical protein